MGGCGWWVGGGCMMMGLMDRRVPRESRHSAAVGSRQNVKRVEPSVDGHSDMNFNMEKKK